MPSTLTPTKPETRRSRPNRVVEAQRVADALDRMCRSCQPGDRLPNLPGLMAQLDASERTVLRAVDNLLREGRIVRRPKAGTIVAEPFPPAARPDVATAVATSSIVAISKPDHAFFSRSVDVLYKLAKAVDVAVMFQPVDTDSPVERVLSATPVPPTGYIVIGSVLIPMARQIAESGRRSVAVGETSAGSTAGVANVHADGNEAGYLCAEHMIALGHRRLGFTSSIDTTRWEGHKRAEAEANLSGQGVITTLIEKSLVVEWKSSPGMAGDYFRRPDAPTAVCMWNDTDAMELIQILNRDGLSVPQDISVIGYDNMPESASFAPPLTTIDTNIAQQLRAALRLLTQETPPTPATEVILSPTLVVRNSTARPAR